MKSQSPRFRQLGHGCCLHLAGSLVVLNQVVLVQHRQGAVDLGTFGGWRGHGTFLLSRIAYHRIYETRTTESQCTFGPGLWGTGQIYSPLLQQAILLGLIRRDAVEPGQTPNPLRRSLLRLLEPVSGLGARIIRTSVCESPAPA